MKISRVMSTQHPDNVRQPFFSDSIVLGGDDEVKEAFYAFSHLKCREQLWDCEGKEVDNFVVKKLLTRYEPFFRKHKLGEDFYLTLRVPNPEVEKDEAKILIEVLEAIPRSFDIAKLFYQEDVSPIFEVTVPMTSNAEQLIRIAEYYKQMVVGKQDKALTKNGLKIKEWIGAFNPNEIRITPLMEDKQSILNADKIAEQYIEHQKIRELQRVWIARSDPALNYGNPAAVLMIRIALNRLYDLQEKSSISILPILGCGTAPFRGNLKPTNTKKFLKGYPSVYTFTIQSAFKYDYDEAETTNAIEEIESTLVKKPIDIDQAAATRIIDKLSAEYQKQITLLAPLINDFSQYIPSRRKRKLHIGLFGYSRGEKVMLPRAIKFCAALYSLGLPPEILSLNALSQKEMDQMREWYPGLDSDLQDALQFFNKKNMKMFPSQIRDQVQKAVDMFEYSVDQDHAKITSIIAKNYKNRDSKVVEEDILRAGWIRGFLG